MAYRDQETIKGTLSCLAQFVDKHIVLINDNPYYGEYEPPDNTEEICRSFPNVDVLKGNWAEHTLRNIGNSLCNDCDWVLHLDADEMIDPKQYKILIETLNLIPTDTLTVRSKTYWHSTDYRLEPFPKHHPIIATKPKAKFNDFRCIHKPYFDIDNDDRLIHHHLSWCEPKNVLRKVTHYNHAQEYDGERWYMETFKKWKPGLPVNLPFGIKFEAVFDPLPNHLKEML